MPNWCNNNITITGPNKIIDKIEKIVKNEMEASCKLRVPLIIDMGEGDNWLQAH